MAVWWLKDFDQQTRDKAAGRPRLLLVDGHNSHYTIEFLQYAREVNINILCYPSHTTHVLQGLDVVAFAILKRRWHAEHDRWESEHWPQKLSKSAFTQLFGAVFLETMTEGLVKQCFEKTGVIPFNAEIVTPRQMAPSKEHSTTIDVNVLPSPVKQIVELQGCLIAPKQPSTGNMDAEMRGLHPSQDPHTFYTSVASIDNDSADIDKALPFAPIGGRLTAQASRSAVVNGDVFMASIDLTLHMDSMDVNPFNVPHVSNNNNDEDENEPMPSSSISHDLPISLTAHHAPPLLL